MVFGGPEHGGAASEEPCYGTGAAGHMAVRPCARLAEVRTARGALRERRYEHEVRGTRVVSAGEQEQQGERGRSRSGNVVILHASMNALLIRNQRRRENIPKTLLACQKSSLVLSLLPSFPSIHLRGHRLRTSRQVDRYEMRLMRLRDDKSKRSPSRCLRPGQAHKVRRHQVWRYGQLQVKYSDSFSIYAPHYARPANRPEQPA